MGLGKVNKLTSGHAIALRAAGDSPREQVSADMRARNLYMKEVAPSNAGISSHV